MSGDSSANKEFLEQLRLQELYSRRNEDGSDPYTYTDPEDGTVYDWDHEKKAWFPKVKAILFLFLVYRHSSTFAAFCNLSGYNLNQRD